MRRALTLFTGSKVATAAAAAALSVVTTLTLVAGGIVVSNVVNTERDGSVTAFRAIDEPLDPIVIEAERLDNRLGDPAVSTASAAAPASAAAGAPASPIRTVSLLDEADRVTGSVHTALDGGEPRRMDEITTVERLQSILRTSEEDEASSEENEAEEPPAGDPAPDESEDRSVVQTAEDLTAGAQEVVGTTVESAYLGTEAGSASPSA